MSVPLRISASSSSALTLGVPLSCSTNSPNALLGTFTPENSHKAGLLPGGDAAVEIGQMSL